MKITLKQLLLMVIFGLLIAGCDLVPGTTETQEKGDTSGAQTWIEFPQNDQVLPNEATTFVVYSTAADGAGNIVLKLDGSILPSGTQTNLSSDGSQLMVRLDQEWTPPRQGEYVLEASSGSGSSSINFCIVTCNPNEASAPVLADTPTPTADISETPRPVTATSTATPTIMPSPTITWAPTWTPTIEPTHTFEPTYTEAPAMDLTGPNVNSAGVYWEGCSLYGTATISDPSGVIWAEFWFNHNEEGWAWILMNQNGDQWVSQVGVETGGFAGSLEYKIRTEDSYNNESWSGVFTKNYSYCGE